MRAGPTNESPALAISFARSESPASFRWKTSTASSRRACGRMRSPFPANFLISTDPRRFRHGIRTSETALQVLQATPAARLECEASFRARQQARHLLPHFTPSPWALSPAGVRVGVRVGESHGANCPVDREQFVIFPESILSAKNHAAPNRAYVSLDDPVSFQLAC